MRVAPKLPLASLPALLLSATCLFAQSPIPNSVQNPASNILPGLPNFGIAQGSIFVVYGAALGPATIVVSPSLPLLPTLSGTSVQVTVGGTTVSAPMIYTLQSQIAAVLPSNTPIGTGTVTVTYNGVSGTTPVQVVKSNFGISTVNETGAGPAVVTFGDYTLVTATNSARPGDTLVIWGTGLGPITGSDAAVPTTGDLEAPLKVYVGGIEADVVYHGRSGQPGLDQINFVVPKGASGCFVSLVVQTGNVVSNTTSMAIATSGGPCSDANGLPVPDLQDPTNTKGAVSFGVINLFQESVSGSFANAPAPPTVIGSASATFEKFTPSQLATGATPVSHAASIGSCLVSTFRQSINNPIPVPSVSATGLDAGPAIEVRPPSGNPVNLTGLAGASPGFYSGTLTTLSPGSYRFTNGTGGADVGAFTATLNFATPATWANQAAITNSGVDRTQPLRVTWTGGDSTSTARIQGSSTVVNGSDIIGATFACSASVAAGEFTVPTAVLLAMPATGTQAGSAGTLMLGTASNPQLFTAPGLDVAYVLSGSFSGGRVIFK